MATPASSRFEAATESPWINRIGARVRLGILIVLAGHFTSSWTRADEKSAEQARTAFQVIAYIPDYRIDALEPALGKGLTDVIFFSIEPRADGDVDSSRLKPEALAKLHELRRLHKTRLLVAVGGWERSRAFPSVATRARTRTTFARNLARFCLENRLDGADFDWEHPANLAEEEGYAELLAEVRRAFEPHRLLVTVALAGWQNVAAKALQAVDRIHIMAYDHEDPRHSTLANASNDVAKLVSRGALAEKICLGVPFYGRNMKDHNLVVSYADLARKHSLNPEVDEVDGIYFNGVKTIERKTQFAIKKGLGGIMIWEIGQDSTGGSSLLKAIQKTRMNAEDRPSGK